MRALIQRVSKAVVSVEGEVTGTIGQGLVVLLGVREGDTESDAKFLAEKCSHLRIFADESGKFNHSCLDVKGEMLIVSQFTLYGDTRKGRRPSFVAAAHPDISQPLYEKFIASVEEMDIKVACGIFGAMMQVEIHNDGPVTLMLESKEG